MPAFRPLERTVQELFDQVHVEIDGLQSDLRRFLTQLNAMTDALRRIGAPDIASTIDGVSKTMCCALQDSQDRSHVYEEIRDMNIDTMIEDYPERLRTHLRHLKLQRDTMRRFFDTSVALEEEFGFRSRVLTPAVAQINDP